MARGALSCCLGWEFLVAFLAFIKDTFFSMSVVIPLSGEVLLAGGACECLMILGLRGRGKGTVMARGALSCCLGWEFLVAFLAFIKVTFFSMPVVIPFSGEVLLTVNACECSLCLRAMVLLAVNEIALSRHGDVTLFTSKYILHR